MHYTIRNIIHFYLRTLKIYLKFKDLCAYIYIEIHNIVNNTALKSCVEHTVLSIDRG
jgi:hypothetical protein